MLPSLPHCEPAVLKHWNPQLLKRANNYFYKFLLRLHGGGGSTHHNPWIRACKPHLLLPASNKHFSLWFLSSVISESVVPRLQACLNHSCACQNCINLYLQEGLIFLPQDWPETNLICGVIDCLECMLVSSWNTKAILNQFLYPKVFILFWEYYKMINSQWTYLLTDGQKHQNVSVSLL